MITTTLNRIREHRPCTDRWEHLLFTLKKTKADDEPLSLEFILDVNGLSDALWCLRAAPEYNHQWRLFAFWCWRQQGEDTGDTAHAAFIAACKTGSYGYINDAGRVVSGSIEVSTLNDFFAPYAAYSAAEDATSSTLYSGQSYDQIRNEQEKKLREIFRTGKFHEDEE